MMGSHRELAIMTSRFFQFAWRLEKGNLIFVKFAIEGHLKFGIMTPRVFRFARRLEKLQTDFANVGHSEYAFLALFDA